MAAAIARRQLIRCWGSLAEPLAKTVTCTCPGHEPKWERGASDVASDVAALICITRYLQLCQNSP